MSHSEYACGIWGHNNNTQPTHNPHIIIPFMRRRRRRRVACPCTTLKSNSRSASIIKCRRQTNKGPVTKRDTYHTPLSVNNKTTHHKCVEGCVLMNCSVVKEPSFELSSLAFDFGQPSEQRRLCRRSFDVWCGVDGGRHRSISLYPIQSVYSYIVNGK